MKEKNINSLLKLLEITLMDKKLFVLFTLTAAGMTLLDVFGISLVFPVLKIIVSTDTLADNKYIAGIMSYFGYNSFTAKEVVPFILVLLSVTYVFKNLLFIVTSYYRSLVARTINMNIKYRCCVQILKNDYAYFIKNRQGVIAQTLYEESGKVTEAIEELALLIMNIMLFVSIFIMLFLISSRVTLVMIGVILGIMLLLYLFSKKIMMNLGSAVIKYSQDVYSIILEITNGIRQIKIFQGEKKALSLFYASLKKMKRETVLQETVLALPVVAIELTLFISVSIILYRMFINNMLNSSVVPFFGLYAAAFIRIIPNLTRISQGISKLAGYAPSVDLIYNFYKVAETNNDKNRAIPIGDRPVTHNKDICFKDVSFSYAPNKYAIKDASLAIEKGMFVGIVGKSGSGKSTLIDLMLRFYVPQRGGIFYDGQPLNEISFSSLMNHIGFVSQDVFLFGDTILNNIIFPRDDYDMDKVSAVIRMVGLEQFISVLPLKVNTQVGEKGLALSGGQRQRVAIARALYKNPDIMIFDEPTSSLDRITEEGISKMILKMRGDKTLILASHRLHLVERADLIVVMDNGLIVERGKHEELMKNKSYYYNLRFESA